MHLAEATWPEVEALASETNLALLPVGSTEQHGPHAPLGTDTYAATAVAAAAESAFDGELAVAPTIPVGVSVEHSSFPGTLWVSPETFRAYIRDVLESLAAHGFDRVVVVNGHGGNTEALREVCWEVSQDGGLYAVPFTWFEEIGDTGPSVGHAGPVETAFLHHRHPELVREDRLAEAAADGAEEWGIWQGATNLALDTAEFSESGTVGDPRDGDAALGEALLETATAALLELVETVRDR